MSDILIFGLAALAVCGYLAHLAIVRGVPFEAILSLEKGFKVLMNHIKEKK